jgi:transaldolase
MAPLNNPCRQLHDLGQSLWLDHISRPLLQSGTLARYMADFSITGLTSNPTIYEQALAGDAYDESIRLLDAQGLGAEEMFFELAMEDMRQAADLFRPVFDASGNKDGWVSLEVSPLLADNTAHTI